MSKFENNWLHESIKPVIKSLRLDNCKINVKNFKTGCGNFLGELYEVDLIKETDTEQVISIFVKRRITLAKVKLVTIEELYEREVFFYNDLSKIYTDLQNKANVPENERYNIANVYNGTTGNEIFLENLTKKGYKTYKRMENIPIKYAKLAVQQLARFHGLSFVLEHELPEYYKNKIKSMETPYNFDEDFQGWIRNICTNTANYFEGEIKESILAFLPIFLKKFPHYHYTSSLKNTVCCLVHGDFRTSNVLVKEMDGEPISVFPVDYQLMSYGNPIRDLLFFFYSSTSGEFRKQYLSQLKDEYFQTLTTFLKYFNLDVENIFPRKKFEKSYNDWIDFGFMIALQSVMFNFVPENANLDEEVQNLSLSELSFAPDKRFVKMIRDVVDELYAAGYFE